MKIGLDAVNFDLDKEENELLKLFILFNILIKNFLFLFL